eukprot:7277834-Prymnesium_polylepis.2
MADIERFRAVSFSRISKSRTEHAIFFTHFELRTMDSSPYLLRHPGHQRSFEDGLSAALSDTFSTEPPNPLAHLARQLLLASARPARTSSVSSLRPPRQLDIHVKARSSDNPAYPPRQRVPDALVRWDAPFEGYSPTEWTSPAVVANGRDNQTGGKWADPPDALTMRAELERRAALAPSKAVLKYDAQSGAPFNPVGRTGMCGRGLLG